MWSSILYTLIQVLGVAVLTQLFRWLTPSRQTQMENIDFSEYVNNPKKGQGWNNAILIYFFVFAPLFAIVIAECLSVADEAFSNWYNDAVYVIFSDFGGYYFSAYLLLFTVALIPNNPILKFVIREKYTGLIKYHKYTELDTKINVKALLRGLFFLSLAIYVGTIYVTETSKVYVYKNNLKFHPNNAVSEVNMKFDKVSNFKYQKNINKETINTPPFEIIIKDSTNNVFTNYSLNNDLSARKAFRFIKNNIDIKVDSTVVILKQNEVLNKFKWE